MSKYEHKSMAYLLENVMKNKFNRAFYVEDLWKYVENKPVKEYNINDVKHWVYSPCWSYDCNGIECYYSIYQTLIQKNKFKKDIRQIKKADVSYPIIVVENDYDKYGTILDGNHRFAKLIMNKEKKVKYKFITKKELVKLMIRV